MNRDQADSLARPSLEHAVEHPPCVPFVLSIGVTGHRQDMIGEDHRQELQDRIRSTLETIIERALRVHATEARYFANDPPRLIFVSPLADGADQLAAETALELGFELHAVLPFQRARYRSSLGDDQARSSFDRLITAAACVLDLPGDPDRPLEAYVMTGRATIAHSDFLLAVWDGLPPRGRGGTGEVVQLAVAKGTAAIHIPLALDAPVRLIWSGFDPAVITQELDETTSRAFEADFIDKVLSASLAPPPDRMERIFLAKFLGEQSRRIRARIEYPLMLAAAGVKPIRARDIRDSHGAAEIESEWAEYRDACAKRHAMDPDFTVLQNAYSWSDRLATYFAQTYRSGHVFNFVLGALAVCIGLGSNILDRGLLEFAILEGFLTAAIIANTSVGVRNEWHRRWLDYRQLAERLRPMRSLKLLGVAAPDAPGTASDPVPRRWIDWYAAGVWRAMGCPTGCLTPDRPASLARAIAEYEVGPQVAYHHRHARQIELLDSRLERIAATLFWITLLGSIFVIAGLATMPDVVNRYGDWLTLVGAGFPALGTAVFGIRFQGDFGGSAVRSLATASALSQIEEELTREVGLNRAADLTEQAARTMLSDLEEWRLVNQQQELDLL